MLPKPFGWSCFPSPSPLVGGAALGGVAFLSFFGVVLRFPLLFLFWRGAPLTSLGGWCCSLPLPCGWCCFLLLLEWDGGAYFPSSEASLLLLLCVVVPSSPPLNGGAFSPSSFLVVPPSAPHPLGWRVPFSQKELHNLFQLKDKI